jgi:hypothetical protein
LKVDKTIEMIQEECGFDNVKIVKFIFDKLESERSLFWIQVARTISNRLCFEVEIVDKL